MPIYEYRALTHDGKAATATIDADSPKEARERLRAQQLMVTALQEVDSGAQNAAGAAPVIRFGLKLPRLNFQRRVKSAELVSLTRQMAVLLRSGIPLAQGLAALVEQAESRRLDILLRDLREKITQGTAFGDSLAQHPRVFNDLYVNMVRAGEAAGNLDEILSRLAEYLTKQNRLRQKLMSAMTYPIILMSFSVMVVIFLMIFVVPKMADVFANYDAELPLLTRIVKGTSDFMTARWYLVLGAAIGAFAAGKTVLATERGAWLWDRFLLRAPLLGDLMRKTLVSRFCVTFSTLLKSGLPALDSLKIVKTILQNRVMSKTVQDVHDRIIEGADISTPLKASGVFPPVVGYMIAVGEQAGQLEEILDKISESYDEEMEHSIQRFTTMLEPILIVFMALVVGAIVGAILIPMMKMGQMIKQGM